MHTLLTFFRTSTNILRISVAELSDDTARVRARGTQDALYSLSSTLTATRQVLLSALIMLTTTSALAQTAPAATKRTTFHRETVVSTVIKASDATVWALLTNAADYPRWNTTVTSIEGNIAAGERIVLRSTLDAKRKFKLQVKEFTPRTRLVWGDGKGQRTYEIKDNGDSSVTFRMHERIGGFMFPLYARAIPSFDASFDTFAADLKREAELTKR